MTSTITFRTGENITVRFIKVLNLFETPLGNMKPTAFHSWLKELAQSKCTHEATLKSNAGNWTRLKLCQTCKAKIK